MFMPIKFLCFYSKFNDKIKLKPSASDLYADCRHKGWSAAYQAGLFDIMNG